MTLINIAMCYATGIFCLQCLHPMVSVLSPCALQELFNSTASMLRRVLSCVIFPAQTVPTRGPFPSGFRDNDAMCRVAPAVYAKCMTDLVA